MPINCATLSVGRTQGVEKLPLGSSIEEFGDSLNWEATSWVQNLRPVNDLGAVEGTNEVDWEGPSGDESPARVNVEGMRD